MQVLDMVWPTVARLLNWTRRRVPTSLAAQSTVEYALVGAVVVIAAAGALTVLGGELTTVFSNISKTLGAAAGGH